MDTICLHQLCAILRFRSMHHWNTRIKLPDGQRVRDFFRAWNLEQGVLASTGQSLYSIVTTDSRRHFGEKPRFYTGTKSKQQRPGGAYQKLLSTRFFGIQSYFLDPLIPSHQALDGEWKRWRSSYVRGVLKRYLPSDDRYPDKSEEIPRVVIYELMANAILHPQAQLVLTSSRATHFESRPLKSGELTSERRRSTEYPHFTICIWDDGLSIARTLRSALEDGRPIRTSTEIQQDLFSIEALNWCSEQRTLPSRFTPTLDDPDELFVLASFFNGISCRADQDSPDERVGSGLHALYRCVIDTLGGELAIRSGKSFIHIEKEDGEASYQAKITRYNGVDFPGTLVIVRIPCDGD